MIAIGNARRPVVRYKAKWADPWITLPRGSYATDGMREGSSSRFGECTIDTLRVDSVNREEGAPAEPALAIDYFVNVGAEDIDLQAGNADRIRWLWLGVVQSVGYVHDGYESTGTEQSLIVRMSWRCEGIAALFQSFICQRALIIGHTGVAATLDSALVFNADGIGNRNATPEADGSYAFRLDADSTCARWTARQAAFRVILDHLNSAHSPNFPLFQLYGQVELLDYTDTWDLRGRPLAECLTTLCGGRRGGTWTMEPSSDVAVLNLRITSGLASDVIAVASGDMAGFTLPASDRKIAVLDTSDSHWLVSGDLFDRPRRWTLEGKRRTTLSLTFRPGTVTAYDGLVRGWPAADDAKAGDADAKYALVYRAFNLDPAWSGRVAEGVGLASALVRVDGAYTGAATYAVAPIPILAAKLDADLVIAETAQTAAGVVQSLASWSGDLTGVTPKNLPRDQARVYVHDGAIVTEITDLFTVKVTNDPRPMVILGNAAEDGAAISKLIGDHVDRRIIVTLTVIEPLPLLVSREPVGATIDVRVRTDAEVHTVLIGTRLSVESTATGTKIVRDDTPLMVSILSGIGPHLDRGGSAKIVHRLDLLPADHVARTGALVLAYDDGRKMPIDLRAVVVSRAWSFAPGSYGTTLELAPLDLDLKAYI